jgi:hypothetical protein
MRDRRNPRRWRSLPLHRRGRRNQPPPWKLKGRPGAEGDLAIKELREGMALAPDLPPEPPAGDNGGAMFGRVWRGAGRTQNALITRLCPSASLVVPSSHKALPGLGVRRSPFAARRAD